MTGNSSIGILQDAVFTLQGTTGGDDGVTTGRTLSGTAVTFKADKVSLQASRSLADYGTNQDEAELNRSNKQPQTVTVETKLEKKANAPLLTALLGTTGVVVQITATATGANIGASYAIVESFEWEYAGPSTLRFTLRQYGSKFTLTAA